MTNQTKYKDMMPYEKALTYGMEALTDAELLGIILRTGTHTRDAVSLGVEVLEKILPSQKGLRVLNYLSLQQLTRVKGIGKVKAMKLKAVAEISKRMAKETAAEQLEFHSAKEVAAFFMEDMRYLSYEKVILLSLDSKGAMIDCKTLSSGSVNASIVPVREIFVHALEVQAVSLLVLHNHPSGNPSPSQADKDITVKIKNMGNYFEIPLTDHIIIGDRKYFSFKDNGYL